AVVIFSTNVFLASGRRPGGASIKTTGMDDPPLRRPAGPASSDRMYLLVLSTTGESALPPLGPVAGNCNARQNAKETRGRIQVQSVLFIIRQASSRYGCFSVLQRTISDDPLPGWDSRPGTRLLESIRTATGSGMHGATYVGTGSRTLQRSHEPALRTVSDRLWARTIPWVQS